MSMYDLMLYMPLHLSQPVLLTVQLSAVHHSTAAPSGERVPRPESEKLNQLCEGIYLLSKEKAASKRTSASITPFTKDEIYTAFTNTLKQPDNSRLCENFNHLLLASSVSLADLARFLNYDSSYLSRIPSDPEWFCSETARFIVLRTPPADRIFIEKLTGQSIKDINDSAALCQLLSGWLLNTNNVSPQINQMQSFLEKLDQFDLNNFIRSICFDELKVPTMPIQLPGSRSYFGIREFMTAELDYLKATVLSPSMENVIMYSDMPMKEMAKDAEFPKKWMFGMALMLKKGLHLCQIHDLDRSLDDMMLGLESWIPMYMTGQIAPYYLKNVQNNAFLHLLKVSGAAALSGEAVAGFHSEGRYYLTKSKKELGYYRKRANDLLSNACPLMEIYRSDREKDFSDFLTADSHRRGGRRSILSALPVYTMDNDLLNSILDRNGIDDRRGRDIKAYVSERKKRVESILETMTIEDEICCLSREEFETRHHALDLSGVFCASDVLYSYDDYSAHLKSTERYAQTHENYSLKYAKRQTFCNLQILIHEGQWAMISKGNAPAIHFVIRHPKLLSALENFIPPVIEDQ